MTDTYDPLGTRQGWTYDPMNRVTMNTRYTAKFAVDTAGCRRSQALCGIDSTAAMDPDLGPTIASSYFYNGNGLDSLRDARGVTRRFTYDGRDLMIAQTDEHQRVDRIFRDGGGLVALSTSRQSDTARYVYDPGGRRRAVVYQRLWSAKTAERIPEDSISYQYDVDDNVLLDSNRIAKIRRTYYGNGAVKTEVVKGLRTDSVQYTYDGSGALVRSARTYNGKTDVIDYTFSAATGELQSITATWGPPANRSRTINFVWDALGRRKRVTLPNGSAQGIRVEYRYDAAGVLRRVMSTNGQDDITKSNRFDFTYKADSVDVAGHILSSKTTCPRIIAGDSDPTGSPCGSGPMVRISNRYNRLGMMARQYDGVLETYKYDASGNMIYRKRGSAAAHYFTMDPQSNQVQRDSAAGVTTNGVKGYAYDWDGDRIYDSVATSLTTIYYTDALGRTVGIRDYAHNGSNRSDCVQYDPDGNMITPCDDDGNQLTYEGPSVAAAHPTRWVFVRGPGVDDPLMALWRPLATSSSDTTEWYLLRTVRVGSSPSRRVTDRSRVLMPSSITLGGEPTQATARRAQPSPRAASRHKRSPGFRSIVTASTIKALDVGLRRIPPGLAAGQISTNSTATTRSCIPIRSGCVSSRMPGTARNQMWVSPIFQSKRITDPGGRSL